MKTRTLTLGTVCTDRATELRGTITHWVFNLGHQIEYVFQPKGLDEEGRPLPYIAMEEERMLIDVDMFEEVDIPVEILGSQVTDNASGFTGMCIGFVRHTNGCFHCLIQPKGVLKRTKAPVKPLEFDLRRCSGEMITQMSEKELKESIAEKPSPTSSVLGERLPAFFGTSVFSR